MPGVAASRLVQVGSILMFLAYGALIIPSTNWAVLIAASVFGVGYAWNLGSDRDHGDRGRASFSCRGGHRGNVHVCPVEHGSRAVSLDIFWIDLRARLPLDRGSLRGRLPLLDINSDKRNTECIPVRGCSFDSRRDERTVDLDPGGLGPLYYLQVKQAIC